MGLFRRKPEPDVELNSRVDRLQSEFRQAMLHCESLPDGAEKQNRLHLLEPAEQALAEARADGDRATQTRAALKVEAELCLTKPLSMLVPTANRLRDKLYRLDDRERAAWETELDQLISNGDVPEETLRPRLQQLTYRSTEAAYRYKRLAKERSKAIRNVVWASLVILAILLCGLVFSLNGLMLDVSDEMTGSEDGASIDGLSWARFKIVFFAGGIGAVVNLVGSMIFAEKKRTGYSSTYISYMILRAVLGGVYALVVYSATLARVLPITIPAELMTAIPLLALLGFASGFSDRLFGQVLSGFITGAESSSKKKGDAGSRA